MSKDTNKQTAFRLFASTTHDVLFANKKGEFFTSENLGAMSLKTGEKLEKFERSEEKVIVEAATEKKELNANDTIAKIKAAISLEAIKEFESDERKLVKSVYDRKAKQLTEAINVVGATGANGNEDTDNQK